MRKLINFCLFIAIIVIFFTTCDTPLKEYIEYATGRAAADEYSFLTKNYKVRDNLYAIPVYSKEEPLTKIIININNPKKGSIKLELMGSGAEFASVGPYNNGWALVTIDNQRWEYEFELFLFVYVNGNRFGMPIELPKLQNLYFNNQIKNLTVITDSGTSLPASYDPYKKDFSVLLPKEEDNIKVEVELYPDVYSKCTINGGSKNVFNIIGKTEIGITVIANCGKPENYTLTVFPDGTGLVMVEIGSDIEYFINLKSAFDYIAAYTIPVLTANVSVLDDIITNDDIFIYNTLPHIYLRTDGIFSISRGREGSIFNINAGVITIGDSGAGTLTLKGINDNNSPLINVNGGDLQLYEKAIIAENNNTAGPGGGVSVMNGGSLLIDGGRIKGNTAEKGGGVYVSSGGSVIFNEGSIEGNTAEKGGGVYITGNSFVMNGGTIGGDWEVSNDNPNPYQNRAEYGGGVFVESGTFDFYNGIIGNNGVETGNLDISGSGKAGNYSSNNGGGVYLDTGNFNYYNDSWNNYKGLITGNWADGDGSGVFWQGGNYNGPPGIDTTYFTGNHDNDNVYIGFVVP